MPGLRRQRLFLPLAFLLVLTYASAAQESSPPPPVNSTGSEGKPAQAEPESAKQEEPKQDEGASAPKAQTKVTPQQAEQLFHEVDTIIDFASKDTDLPMKHGVKRRLTDRADVVAYLKKSMAEDKDVQRLRRTELVLKKFGLLPHNFDLQSFLVDLLEEQVAGYYDSKTKTVNLLDWVEPDLQRPVLAHELTHALQDQSFGLDRWLDKSSKDIDAIRNITPDDITNDENSEARQAVVEGQAMVVLLDYMLVPMHRNVADSPDIVDALNDDMQSGTPDSVEYRNAPIFLKESLTFPYRYGLEFEAEVLRAEGKDKAFAGPFQNPPRTSREIMEPKTYINGEHIPPLPLPDFKRIFKNYDRFDIGAIGEFDVDVIAEQYAGKDAADRIYPNWRGGYYYSVHPKGNPQGLLGLLFVSRWANDKAAEEFAGIYVQGIAERYKNPQSRPGSDLPSDLKQLHTLGGDHAWKTEEGNVVIDVKGDTVLVTESLDDAITQQFKSALFGGDAETRKSSWPSWLRWLQPHH